MTDMGRLGWSDPAKAKPMLDTIPLGRFAGKMWVFQCLWNFSTMLICSQLSISKLKHILELYIYRQWGIFVFVTHDHGYIIVCIIAHFLSSLFTQELTSWSLSRLYL